MQQNQHSEEFKKSAVQKILLRGGKTVEQICEELSISRPTFYEWRKEYANAPGMKTKDKRPQDRTAGEKFKAVTDFEALSGENRGEFLRRQGLHTDNIPSAKSLFKILTKRHRLIFDFLCSSSFVSHSGCTDRSTSVTTSRYFEVLIFNLIPRVCHSIPQ